MDMDQDKWSCDKGIGQIGKIRLFKGISFFKMYQKVALAIAFSPRIETLSSILYRIKKLLLCQKNCP